ncbi:MAG: hypothetical protein Q4B69_01835 [Slackia sp.]|nr:hypothetical protein [Slackia sp.]
MRQRLDGGFEIERGHYAPQRKRLSSRKHRETPFTQFHAMAQKRRDVVFCKNGSKAVMR